MGHQRPSKCMNMEQRYSRATWRGWRVVSSLGQGPIPGCWRQCPAHTRLWVCSLCNLEEMILVDWSARLSPKGFYLSFVCWLVCLM